MKITRKARRKDVCPYVALLVIKKGIYYWRMDKSVKDKINKATEAVQEFLAPTKDMTDDVAKTILKRYVAGIEGNFLAWMAGASISSRSLQGKFASDENLWVELKDDHPSMLRELAICAKAEPNSEDFQYVHKEVVAIRNMVAELSGLKNLTLMTALENTSSAFIPYLSELASKLGCSNVKYTEIHGEADILHANQFLNALSDEKKFDYKNAEGDIDEAVEKTLALLRKIFKTM